jgi:hypothetical protein
MKNPAMGGLASTSAISLAFCFSFGVCWISILEAAGTSSTESESRGLNGARITY